MRKTIIFLALIFSLPLLAQYNPDECLFDLFPEGHSDIDSTPKFMQPGWGQVKYEKLAIVYIDFPDGRWDDNGVLKQPYYTKDLESITNPGASAEVGLTFDESPYPVGNNGLHMNASKYSWHDRWDLYFSEGIYNNEAHPDWSTHGDSAYGSMKEYWLEVSNEKFNVTPAETHSNETDPKLKTGIVNNFTILEDDRVMIEYIMMDKDKYGPISTSYFPNYEYYSYLYETDPNWNQDLSRIELLFNDAKAKIRILSSQGIINFDGMTYDDFINPSHGGVVIIVFAGSHLTFKGIAYQPYSTALVRGMAAKPEDGGCRIDGFSNTAHEFGHASSLRWLHSAGGRYCLMNTVNTRDINCPSHPNPLFKIREGWLEAIPLEFTQQVDELPPVVSSHQVGIVTIYGKPTFLPDFSCGESFILENRKKIGFDRKIIHPDQLHAENFKGGLLIWHYSTTNSIGIVEPQLKLIPANGDTEAQLKLSAGNRQHFFAYKIDPILPEFRILDQNKTYSSFNIKTGIEIEDIEQNNYSDVNSSISLNLNYLISEPVEYDQIIYESENNDVYVELDGLIYYHKTAFDIIHCKINPGCIIETINPTPIFAGAKIRGYDNNPVIFRGAGYENTNEVHRAKYFNYYLDNKVYGSVDSLVIENLIMQNVTPQSSDIRIWGSGTAPISISKLYVDFDPYDEDHYDLELSGGFVAKLELNNISVFFDHADIDFFNDIIIDNSIVKFHTKAYFAEGKGMYLTNCKLRMTRREHPYQKPVLDKIQGASSWEGLYMEGGRASIDQTTIKNAENGFNIVFPDDGVTIQNSIFDNNLFTDISIYNNTESVCDIEVKDNNFICADDQYGSIELSDIFEAKIENNNFENAGLAAITLSYCYDPLIKGNVMTGTNDGNVFSCGIISENSSGYYECNTISNFNDFGVFLSNSQPALLGNWITDNAYGLFVTNNSYPVMAPAFSFPSTFIFAGFNVIEDNSNEEIYVNEDYLPSVPYMYAGENIVQDAENDILIYNGAYVTDRFKIPAEENYWGGDEPIGRFEPEESVSYDPWLTDPPGNDCNIAELLENNSSLSESMLLFGSALKDKYNTDYESASSKFIQLFSDTNYKLTSLANLYFAKHLERNDLSSLKQYYSAIASSIVENENVIRKARDYAIETRVTLQELNEALDDYDDIINTSTNSVEILYALLGKQRVLRLMSYSQGGDNLYIQNSGYIEQKRSARQVGSLTEDPLEKELTEILSKSLEKKEKFNLSQIKGEIPSSIALAVYYAKENFVPKRGVGFSSIRMLNEAPLTYELNQNYPNPFNPLTNISFSIPVENLIKLKIYDITGREVAVLINSQLMQPGKYDVQFNGSKFSSGVYFYRIESWQPGSSAGSFIQTKRMMLIK
jgi:hypothetical protein